MHLGGTCIIRDMPAPFVCEKCRQPFSPGQPLYYQWWIDYSRRDVGLSFISLCHECRLVAHDEYLRQTECLECHRPIYSYRYYQRPWLCSKACRIKAQTRRQKEQCHAKRRAIQCAVCHQEFFPTRSDAKTCSDRCRTQLSRAHKMHSAL